MTHWIRQIGRIGQISLMGLVVAAQAVCAATPSAPEVERALDQLKTGDWILQAEAMAQLGQWKAVEAVAQLDGMLQDTRLNPWLRGQALSALVAIRGAEAQADALQALKSREPALRAAAVEALNSFDGAVMDQALERCLDDGDPEVRYRAVAAYARRKGAAAWERVSAQFDQPDTAVLPLVARALGRIGTEPARARLYAMLEAGDTQTRKALLDGMTGDADPAIVTGLIEQLAALPGESALVESYRTAIERFSAEKLAEPLATLFASPRPNVPQTALRLLYTKPSVAGGEALAARIRKDTALPEPFLLAALDALARGDLEPRRHQELFAALSAHPTASIRMKAVRNLALCGEADLYKVLKPVLGDKDPAVVQAALAAFKAVPADRVPAEGIVQYLAAPLATGEAGTLRLALDQVRQRGLPEEFDGLVNALRPKLDTFDAGTRRMVLDALGDIADRRLAHRVAMLQGYAARWQVIGTFMSEMNAGYDTAFPPENEFNPETVYDVDYKPAGSESVRTRKAWWFKWDVDRMDGRLVMSQLMPSPADNVLGYAAADIYCDEPRSVRVNAACDDMIKLWVNGALVIRTDPEREADKNGEVSASREVRLQKGANRFLVKTGNVAGDWWFSVLLTEPDGRRFEVLHEEPAKGGGQ